MAGLPEPGEASGQIEALAQEPPQLRGPLKLLSRFAVAAKTLVDVPEAVQGSGLGGRVAQGACEGGGLRPRRRCLLVVAEARLKPAVGVEYPCLPVAVARRAQPGCPPDMVERLGKPLLQAKSDSDGQLDVAFALPVTEPAQQYARRFQMGVSLRIRAAGGEELAETGMGTR